MDDIKRRNFFKRLFGPSKSPSVWDRSPVGQTNLLSKGEQRQPTTENFTMMQGFEWYVPDDHQHWKRLQRVLPDLKETGIDNIWIPPGCKASSPSGNGYDVYDLYDLGEFDTKGSVGTKWGTKQELMGLINTADEIGVGIYWDAVLNHKAAADHMEKCKAVEVNSNNRLQPISDPYEIEGWLGFDFAVRDNKYSSLKYHWYHFTGTDYNAANQKTAIYKIMGDHKDWAPDVDSENANYDYLMFADVDFDHPEVREDVKKWGEWIGTELKLKGFRFDAIKHFSLQFLLEFMRHLDETVGEGWFMVGEFWKASLPSLTGYLEKMEHKFCLFDAPLVYKFSSISQGNRADLRQVFDGTLVQVEPYNAVTLVMNHDTQPSQALAAPISGWFTIHAYSLILLRESGYPCIFYGDLYGLRGGVPDKQQSIPAAQGKIPDLCLARKLYAYGEQNDYFDQPNCVGWVRRGTWDYTNGCAVLISNAEGAAKRMFVGEAHQGESWTDVLGWEGGEVKIGADGWGEFRVGSCSASIWVNGAAHGRERFGRFDSKIYG